MDAQFRIIPKIVRLATCQTWILLSSHQLGFHHLTTHVRYVKEQTMLIKCCFAIIAMVDTIFYASNQSSLKFLLAFGIVHHVLLQHLDFYSDHATLFFGSGLGGGYMRISSQPPLVHYIYVCVCISFWVISFYL
jgi:hypothetical protein